MKNRAWATQNVTGLCAECGHAPHVGGWCSAPTIASEGGCDCFIGPIDIEEHEWVIEPEVVHLHVGHHIEIVTYADRNLAIQCEDCGSIIADIDYGG